MENVLRHDIPEEYADYIITFLYGMCYYLWQLLPFAPKFQNSLFPWFLTQI